MRLEQVIRSTMTEAADMDGRLDQLVRAGLMPTGSLPLLKRALSRMHAGMSLQGAERDVMSTFINSMMFIVLGDDTVFNKARAGARGYATEEVESIDELSVDAMKKYRTAARTDAMDADDVDDDRRYRKRAQGSNEAGKKIVRKGGKLGEETELEEGEEKGGGYDGMPKGLQDRAPRGRARNAMGRAIAKKERNLTRVRMDREMNKEEVESIDELSVKKLDQYRTRARQDIMDIDLDNRDDDRMFDKRAGGYLNASKQIQRKLVTKQIQKKLAKEEVEQVDEISKATMGRYINKAKDSIDMTSYRSGVRDAAGDEYKPKNRLERKLTKRHKGIETAVKKLTKEDIDAVKKMNESYKTAFQTALNEYGIKSPSELDESKRKEFFNHVDLEFKKGDN